MTKNQNRKFLRLGVFFFMMSGSVMAFFFLTMPGSEFYMGDLIPRILLFVSGISGVMSFFFLVILGVFPHILKFHLKNISLPQEGEILAKIDFLTLED